MFLYIFMYSLIAVGYDVNHLHLIWTNAHPIQLDDQVELPQFTLSSVEHNQGVSKYSLGKYSHPLHLDHTQILSCGQITSTVPTTWMTGATPFASLLH